MMSDDKLSEWEMREEIQNLLSWGHAHDFDAIIQEARADAWDEGKEDAMRGLDIHGDTDAENPYREQEEV